MFKLVQSPEFSHDVPVMVPVDGGHEEQSLRIRFRVADGIESSGSVDDLLDRIVVRAENLVDDAGKPIEWSDEIRQRLLKMPFVRVAIMDAYRTAVTKVRAGN